MTTLNKFGKFLVDNDYFPMELVSKATGKMTEYGENSASSLARVLEADFAVSHDNVYEALAKLYAFPQFELDIETLDSAQESVCKEILTKIPDDFKKKLFYHKIFPIGWLNGNRDTLRVLASDTTHRLLQEIASNTPYKRYEIFWCKRNSNR